MRYIYTLIIIILNCCSSSFSQNNILNDSNNKDLTTANITLIPDNPVAAMLDSLANSRFFNFDDSCDIFYNKYNFSEEYIPSYDDSTYRTRIKILDDKSPFDLVYNQDVRSFIELYAIKKRKLTARILGLAKLYFPYFEAQLDKFGLPLELKYLAVAESALNPVATSPAGAKGIWQFMYYTGKQYDLEVTSYIDERNDPYKSTIAACRHFIDLYNIYNDWTLVIAAYNCGAGNVNKAIRRAGGETNFWKIRQFLPAETQSYVPAFIAVNYVMNYAKEHNIYPIMPKITHYQIDTVQIKQLITFKQISEVINIPIEDLQYLNPQYKKNVIPISEKYLSPLVLPKQYIASFINNEQTIYNYKKDEQEIIDDNFEQPKIIARYHKVKRGNTLSQLAKLYKCSPTDIKRWNNLHSNHLKVGSNIIVAYYVEQPKPKPKNETKTDTMANKTQLNESTKYNIHKIEKGETLFSIASKYNTSIENIKQINQMANDSIKIGQEIKIPIDTSFLQNNQNNEDNYTFYTIQKGDTVWSIANKHNMELNELLKINNLANTNVVPGQKIKVKANK